MTDVSDDFSGTLGNWTQYTGEYNSGTVAIVSGGVRTSSTGDNEAAMYWSADAIADDQYAQVSLAAASNTFSGGGPMCRCQTGSFSGYMVYVAHDLGANNIILQRYDSGSGTTLDSVSGVAVSVSDAIKIDATGSAIKGYLNGSEILSATDSTYATGTLGIELYTAGTGNDFRLDDFVGGPIAGGGAVNKLAAAYHQRHHNKAL